MAKWVSVNDKLPPTSESVVLFIKQYRSDSGAFWDSYCLTGFWSDEFSDDEEGFYVINYTFESIGDPENFLDGVCNHEFIGYGNKFIRITHWMYLPAKPK